MTFGSLNSPLVSFHSAVWTVAYRRPGSVWTELQEFLFLISETCMFYSWDMWLIQLHVCPQMVKRWRWFIPVWHNSYSDCGLVFFFFFNRSTPLWLTHYLQRLPLVSSFHISSSLSLNSDHRAQSVDCRQPSGATQPRRRCQGFHTLAVQTITFNPWGL